MALCSPGLMMLEDIIEMGSLISVRMREPLSNWDQEAAATGGRGATFTIVSGKVRGAA